MKDPDRWLDDQSLSSEMRELLRAGAAPPAMPEEQERRIGMFVTRVAAGTLGTSLLFSTKVVAAMVALAAGGTMTWAAMRYTAEREPAPARVEQTANVATSPAVAARRIETSRVDDSKVRQTPTLAMPNLPVRTAETVAPPPAVDAASARPAHREARTVQTTHAPALPAATDALAAEAALLEQARALLKTNPKLALNAAENHARSFRNGQLAAERELIAIDALQRLGRSAEAERRARALIAREPNGMYARRAQRLIDANQP